MFKFIAQIHTKYAEDALRLSELASKPASKRARSGMKAKIGDDIIFSDFKVGDTLHYDVKVNLEKLDNAGNIIAKLESKDEKITEDGVEIVRTTQVWSPVFEAVHLKAGVITSYADSNTEEAKNRRYEQDILMLLFMIGFALHVYVMFIILERCVRIAD